jgi:hypothetical protein
MHSNQLWCFLNWKSYLSNNIIIVSYYFRKVCSNDEDLKEANYFTLEQTNYEIENTNDYHLLFDLFPIERGIISLISSIMIVES